MLQPTPDPRPQSKSKSKSKAKPEAKPEAKPDDGAKPGSGPKRKQRLTFSEPRPQLDTSPADPAAPGPGNANLTPHVNDPAMRRAPPAEGGNAAVGGSHSGISPLARDSATPAHEDRRRQQDCEAADLRARRREIPPRQDIEEWQETQQRNHT